MATTYGDALAKIGVTIPDHLVADAEVPVLTAPQAQGDLLIVPAGVSGIDWRPVPEDGIQVVVGEATGNTHWLHRGFESPDVCWARLDDGLLYIMMHGLAKGGLFLCAGIVEQNTHTKDITKLGGLIKTMPVTAIAFLFCSFSVMGIPPFGGFFSKYMVMTSTIKAGELWIMLTFLIGAIMTIIYLLRVFSMVFLGEAKTKPVREGSATMVISVASLAVLSIIAGFAIAWPSQFVMAAILHLPGVIR